MRMSRAVIVLVVLTLAACSGDKGIRVLDSNGQGPDEFRILPNKPLETPKSYVELQAPTPGGSNLVDQTPIADAVAALGGSRKATQNNGISKSDGGVVNYVSRFGSSGNIRTVLAEEDAVFRKRRGRFTNIRIVKEDRYNKVYEDHILDAYPELYRWRRAGVRTPAVAPEGS